MHLIWLHNFEWLLKASKRMFSLISYTTSLSLLFIYLFFSLCVDYNVTDCTHVNANYWETIPQGNNCLPLLSTEWAEHELIIVVDVFKIALTEAQRDLNDSMINTLWCWAQTVDFFLSQDWVTNKIILYLFIVQRVLCKCVNERLKVTENCLPGLICLLQLNLISTWWKHVTCVWTH